ncbi:MAG TPA: HAMP domain-containing sensor histidine kinase [Actinomycetes bacterium]|nr:HAMP domain-containing sensor histidine kinase [Actinomycetes bacterium]
MNASLRARVALAAAGAVALVVAIAGATLLADVVDRERADVDRTLARRADRVAAAFDAAARAGTRIDVDTDGRVLAMAVNARVLAGDEVLLSVGDLPAAPFPPAPERGYMTVSPSGDPWRTYTRPLSGAVDGKPLRLQVAVPLDSSRRTISFVRLRIVRNGVFALGIAALLGWVFGAAALRPLARLQAAAERVAVTSDLGVRVPAGGPEEVAALAATLNDMLRRLEASAATTRAALESSRSFAAAAGHELRTPLTSIHANLDVLRANPDLGAAERGRVLHDVAEQQQRVVALLDALQALAAGDAAADRARDRLDLGDLVDAEVHALQQRHTAVAVQVRDGGDPVEVEALRDGLELAVRNLLENAAVHGGGKIAVALERDAAVVRVIVDDDGPGVPEADRGRVLGRFVRGSGARGPGSGLGLALVDQQARLHGGRVGIGSSPLGGARVTLTLPARAG